MLQPMRPNSATASLVEGFRTQDPYHMQMDLHMQPPQVCRVLTSVLEP